jgi:hypothetical protein
VGQRCELEKVPEVWIDPVLLINEVLKYSESETIQKGRIRIEREQKISEKV